MVYLRYFFVSLLLLCFTAEAGWADRFFSSADKSHAKNALYHAKKGRWDDAHGHAKCADDPVIADLMVWLHLLNDGEASLAETHRLLKTYPHWPKASRIREQAEQNLWRERPSTAVIEAYFADFPPVSGYGKRAWAEAMQTRQNPDQTARILTLIRNAWIEGDFTKSETSEFRQRYKKYLTSQDHIARIDRLIWDRHYRDASAELRYVGKAHTALFRARIALARDRRGVDRYVRAVPASLRDDPGLAYERIRWRMRRDRNEDYGKLIPKNTQAFAEKWWPIKAYMVYEYLEDKRYKKAYEFASNNHLSSGVEFAQAEWLAGWIALRFLNDPRNAYMHFFTLYHGVSTPISLARGAYWAGRSAKANGNEDIARNWFLSAAKHSSTFYGQLALHELGAEKLILPPSPATTGKYRKLFIENSAMKAFVLIEAYGQERRAEQFLKSAIDEAKNPEVAQLIARYVSARKQPKLAILAAKQAISNHTLLLEYGYPTLQTVIAPPEPALTHAIIRQESQFDRDARSHAGALGMMQLMPRTALQVARQERVRYSKRRLTGNAAYNIRLGQRFLHDLIESQDGSYILAIASYNAGPGNVRKWVRQNGDPRKMQDPYEIIDWLEQIPFKETRNYVQRVLENAQIYRQRLGGTPQALRIVLDLQR